MKNFIAYDFETTGRDARFDQVLQAGFNNNTKLLHRLAQVYFLIVQVT